MLTRTKKRSLQVCFLNSVLIAACATTTAQITGTKPPNPNITAPGPQRHGPPAQPQSPPPSARAPQPTRQILSDGTIEGFVYWDTHKIKHNPAGSCSGLAITVSVGSNSGGPLTAYSPLATLSNNIQYVGQVKEFLSGGKVIVYDVCSYGYDKVPVGPNLQVKLTVTDPYVFSPSAQPQSGIVGPIQIINGQCNMLPRIMNPTASDLLGHWGTCQNMAYDVNFPMAIPWRPPLNGAIVPSNSGGQAGLLSGAQQQGMLSAGSTQSAPPQSGSGMLLGNTTPATTSGAVGFTAGVKPGMAGGSATGIPSGTTLAPSLSSASPSLSSGSASFVPPMPPISSNARRNAAQPADVTAKLQINTKLKAQLVAAQHQTGLARTGAVTAAQGNVPEIHALQQQITFVSSLRTQGALAQGAVVTAQARNQVRIQPAGSSNPLLQTPLPAKICPSPQVHAVNGKTSGVVFTQDPKYNDYIIAGCGFGTQPGQAYLSGAITGGRINLAIKQWSDTQIEAVVQPGLTGVLDGWPDLIIAPSDSSPAKFPNCRFYAQRQSVLLPSIPQQYVTLANVVVGDSTHGMGTKYCPGPDLSHLFPCIAYNAGPPLDGITNGHDHRNDPSQQVSNAVDRDGGQLQFNSGSDVYDLSYMAPGFEIYDLFVFWYAWTSDVCEGWASDATPKKLGDSVGYYTEGYYNINVKTKTKIVIGWGVDHCAWRWLGMFKVDDWYNSGYSLQVQVIGPIGVDPWTGHPVTTARNFGQAQPNRMLSAP